jgi:16S rRNA G966 N2-methylase RsmD
LLGWACCHKLQGEAAPATLTPIPEAPQKNKLYYGDNLAVLRDSIPSNSVDLIYLDPPFNSRQDYNVLFAEKDGSRSASQITAFKHVAVLALQ